MRIRHENRLKLLLLAFLIVITSSQQARSPVFTPFCRQNLPFIINNVAAYEKSISTDSLNRLIPLQLFIPQLVVDLKYNTIDNFTHTILYRKATAYARLPTATALKNVNSELNVAGLGLKVFDAYRPYSVTKQMWKVVHDERYTANPAKGSGHNRGAAVDVTLVKLSTKEELIMPTLFDDFSEKAHHDYMNLPEEAINNRRLLKDIMEKYGFEALSTEWWHYTLPNAASRFAILDLSFRQLKFLQNQ